MVDQLLGQEEVEMAEEVWKFERRKPLVKPGIGLQQKELLWRELSKKRGRELNELQWKGLLLRLGKGRLLRLGKDRLQPQRLQLQEKNRVNQMILSHSSVWVPELVVLRSKGLQQW